MSDSSTTGVDPRFDPRFQRGYADAAADVRASSSSTYPPRVGAGAGSASPEVGDAAARLLEAMQRTAPAGPVRPLASVVSGAGPDESADDAPAAAAVAAPGPEPESEPVPGGWHERAWFIAGWALSGGLLALGAWWVWAVNSNPANYTGVMIGDMVFTQLGWTLAPEFMRLGALGLILVTTFAAARQLDRTATSRRTNATDAFADDHGFWRTPGVVALISIAAASTIIMIWCVKQIAEQGPYGIGPDASDDALMAMALSQFASSAIGPLALAAIGCVLSIILLGARHTRRAAVTADSHDVSEPPAR